jgi:hypothetical protein
MASSLPPSTVSQPRYKSPSQGLGKYEVVIALHRQKIPRSQISHPQIPHPRILHRRSLHLRANPSPHNWAYERQCTSHNMY